MLFLESVLAVGLRPWRDTGGLGFSVSLSKVDNYDTIIGLNLKFADRLSFMSRSKSNLAISAGRGLREPEGYLFFE